MNKVAAEIIAGLIPCKMARNRWRGILRYGLCNALRLRRRIRKDTSGPRYYLAVCAIAKNEGPYFKEWIEWHRRMGVEKFYIYDNESTDCTREVLEPYIASGLVEYRYFPGHRMQLAAYDDCLEKYRFEMRWLAIIDLDEFIVPVKDKTIPEFLSRFENASVVELNWLVYGSGGAKTKAEGCVMERFKRHSLPEHILNRHVKSIVNPKRVFSVIGCHEVARISGYAYDSHGNPIKRNFRDRAPQQDVIRINHYAVKSYEEFLGKRARGRARCKPEKKRGFDYFEQYDLNDIEEK
ncbi:MAG: glycosyltransferase family 92 protein [Bacteroides sp.]|nr:glycosyltransferase family 92 protein [Ruminococcus flavefaciens]MCM1553895.1 glycosyltransferase family 92 protein [Bacteroides sp.]